MYLSEVILGMPYDLSADVFSFGMVMLEIITRQRVEKVCARGPADFFAVVPDKVRNSGIIPKDVPPRLLDLAFACTVYEPKQRPNFAMLLQALQEILSSIPSRSRSNAVRSAIPALPLDEKKRADSAKQSPAVARKGELGDATSPTESGKISSSRAMSQNVMSKGKSPRKGVQELFSSESPK